MEHPGNADPVHAPAQVQLPPGGGISSPLHLTSRSHLPISCPSSVSSRSSAVAVTKNLLRSACSFRVTGGWVITTRSLSSPAPPPRSPSRWSLELLIHGPRKSCHSLAEEPISGSRSLTVLVSLPPHTPQCTEGTVPHTRPPGASPESTPSAQYDISSSPTQYFLLVSIFSLSQTNSSSFQALFVRTPTDFSTQ